MEITHSSDSTNNKYLQVREKAYNLETELDKAEDNYKEQIMEVIKKIQLEFYKKYGSQIQELNDLTEAIEQYKYQGYKKLKKQLNQLYLQDLTQQGGDPGMSMKSRQDLLKEKTKQLYEEYTQKYNPEDNYQKKRNMEAEKLQNAILGLNMSPNHY